MELATIAFCNFDFVHEPIRPPFLPLCFTPKKREGNWFVLFLFSQKSVESDDYGNDN